MEGQDLEAIRRTVRDAATYQNEVDALVSLHTPDAIVVNIAGRRVLGRETFRDAMQQALATPLANVFTSVEIDDIRFIRPDVAIASCTKTVDDKRESSATQRPDTALPATGALTYVLVKERPGWRIALAQTTPIRV